MRNKKNILLLTLTISLIAVTTAYYGLNHYAVDVDESKNYYINEIGKFVFEPLHLTESEREAMQTMLNDNKTILVSGSFAAFSFSNLSKETPEDQKKLLKKALISMGMKQQQANINASKIIQKAASRGFRGLGTVGLVASTANWAYQWYDESDILKK